MSDDIQQDARIVLGSMMFLGAIKDQYNQDDATASVKQWMEANGVSALTVKDETGQKVGTLTYTPAGQKPVITDLDALTAWVEKTHPEHIITTSAVRQAYLKKLLDDAAQEGTPVDTSTGEVPPGIEMRAGDPKFSRRPDAAAKKRMTELVKNTVLPALPALAQPDPGRWTQEELDAVRARAQRMAEEVAGMVGVDAVFNPDPIIEHSETEPTPTGYTASDFDDYRTT